MLDYNLALDLTPYLVNEKDYVPWMSALNNLAYIATQFSTLDSENNENTHYYLAYKVRTMLTYISTWLRVSEMMQFMTDVI